MNFKGEIKIPIEITKVSLISQKTNTVAINMTPRQYHSYMNGVFVGEIFPELKPSEREFLMTGITDEEWQAFYEPCCENYNPALPNECGCEDTTINRTKLFKPDKPE